METLQLLGVALGLASLAGINLYLTVFATGMAVRLGWVQLAPQYESLSVLADPIVLTIAGIFFLAEFLADKVPWVDSAWDAAHTLIRPIGAALIAVTALGDSHPVFDVIVGLLGGGIALSTHGAKSSTRLLVNASPEPFSNVGASLAGDGVVLGGVALTLWNPVLALALVIVAVGTIGFFGPRIFRSATSRLYFAWKKLGAPALAGEKESSHNRVPVALECAIHRIHKTEFRCRTALPVVADQVSGVARNRMGYLVEAEDGSLYFACRKLSGAHAQPIETNGQWNLARGFLFDRIQIGSESGKTNTVLSDRGAREFAESWVQQHRAPEAVPTESTGACG
jgi:hypothetical protein